jgi:RHS repeat-associated protein
MPGRKFTGTATYRYGFNGKEEDDDVKGDGNQQDYGMRIYDTRLGRFLSADPITAQYPELTPYQFASNSPIAGIDRDGLEFEQLREQIQQQRKGLKNVQDRQVKALVITRTNICHTVSPVPSGNNRNANGPNIFKRTFDTWFPQLMIYGNGEESIGSKASGNRPIQSINLSEDGEAGELISTLMLFTDLYRNKSTPKNPGEEIVESTPEMVQKTLDDAKKRIEENKKNKISDAGIPQAGTTTTQNTSTSNSQRTNSANKPNKAKTTYIFLWVEDYSRKVKKGQTTDWMTVGDTVVGFIRASNGNNIDTFLVQPKGKSKKKKE